MVKKHEFVSRVVFHIHTSDNESAAAGASVVADDDGGRGCAGVGSHAAKHHPHPRIHAYTDTLLVNWSIGSRLACSHANGNKSADSEGQIGRTHVRGCGDG